MNVSSHGSKFYFFHFLLSSSTPWREEDETLLAKSGYFGQIATTCSSDTPFGFPDGPSMMTLSEVKICVAISVISVLFRLALRRLASRNTLWVSAKFDICPTIHHFPGRCAYAKTRTVQKPPASIFMCGHLGYRRGPKTFEKLVSSAVMVSPVNLCRP